MKKALFFAVAMLTASFANAQETENNEAASASLKPEEGSFITEVAFCPFTNNSTSLENGRLNAAYMLTDNLAVRAGLGFGFGKTKNDDAEAKSNTFSFAPGIVYSFDGTPKFSPYVGGELIVRTSKEKVGDETTSEKNGFGVQAFTGMNYYFSQNLYVGVEFGIGFSFDKDKKSDVKTTSFAPYAQPAVRLGWAF